MDAVLLDSPSPNHSITPALFLRDDELQRQMDSCLLGGLSERTLILLLSTELLCSTAYFDYEHQVGSHTGYSVLGGWCLLSLLLSALHVLLLCLHRNQSTVTPSSSVASVYNRKVSALFNYAGIGAAASSNLLADSLVLRYAYLRVEESIIVVIIAAVFPLFYFVLSGGTRWRTLAPLWMVSFLSILISAAAFSDDAPAMWYMVALSAISGGAMYTLRLKTFEYFLNHKREDECHDDVIANKLKSDNLESIIGTVSHDIRSQLLPLALGMAEVQRSLVQLIA